MNKFINKILLLAVLSLIPLSASAHFHRQPSPTPVAVTPTPSSLQLGAFNANVGTISVAFDGWTDSPSCFSGKTTFLYWENYGYSLDSIISGSQDSVIKNFASKICPNTILSVFHEMNLADGSNSWAGALKGNTPAKVVAAYQHIHDIIGNKVKWAWVINNSSYPNTSANQPSAYYPGSSYVDIVGVDGFDWGGTSFAQAIQPGLSQVTGYGKPVWVTSTGTATNQATWITAAISYAKSNNIGAILYFSYNDGANFQLTSSGLASLK